MEKEIEQFDSVKLKPISEGLGLNHFADGLPYAPTRKTRKPMTVFAFPPTATLDSPRQMPAQSDPHPNLYSAAPTFATPTQPITAEPAVVEPAIEVRPAGFSRRTFAYAIDLVVLSAAYFGIVWAAFAMNGYDLLLLLASRAGSNLFGPLSVFFLVVYLAYFLIQETGWKTTLGKSLFKISIDAGSGVGLITRNLLFFASVLPMGIGIVWALFDHEHRCWHDVMTGSRLVVRTWPFEN